MRPIDNTFTETFCDESSQDLRSKPYEKCEKEIKKLGTVVLRSELISSTIFTSPDAASIETLPLPVQTRKVGRGAFKDPIPAKSGSKLYRNLRFIIFSTYRRLFTAVAIANIIVLGVLKAKSEVESASHAMNNMLICAAVNLLVSVIVRHEHFVNLLFIASCNLPTSTPLPIRRHVAKIYTYGGLHSGCGLMAILWYIAYCCLVGWSLRVGRSVPVVTWVTTFCNTALLIAIASLAIPLVRSKLHNWFEATHRFAGWSVVGLFWIQCIYQGTTHTLTREQTRGLSIVSMPVFWCLTIITCCIIYPWVHLRRRRVRIEPLSNHAIRLHFASSLVSYGQALKIGTNPLKELHAFAVIPGGHGQGGFSMVISNAGDWTKRLIQKPPQHIWTRGIPQYGVLRIAGAFQPVVIVATGSGIGPCLSLFLSRPNLRCRILWSTPNPLATYGQEIVARVLQTDPRAAIIDTRLSGRPDLTELAYKLYREVQAEAVVIISNAHVTRKVVYGLESRGVPVYGPIFDS